MREWLGLKDILRTGWVRAGVDSPESVAFLGNVGAICAPKISPNASNRDVFGS